MRSPSRFSVKLRAPIALALAYLASRLAYYLAGVRLSTIGLVDHQYPQQLDLPLLKAHLAQSIWHLQSQPPLFNLATGILLKLPMGTQQPIVVIGMMALGLCMVLSCYYLCLELGLPGWLAIVVTMLVILDPAYVLFENLFFYTYPTAVMVTLAALSIARYSRTCRHGWGLLFFSSVAIVILLNSTFQWMWMVLSIVPVVLLLRRDWRSVATVALVPLLVVALWYAKNAVMFSTYSTSSWLGMNAEKITTAQESPSELRTLINEGVLTPIAALPAFFSDIPAYVPRFVDHKPTGVPALDEESKHDGTPNFNNIDIVAISNEYLKNDLRFIAARPATYARSVGRAYTLFMVPSDQYFISWQNATHFIPYLRAYDLLVEGQIYGTNIETMYKDASQSASPGIAHIGVVVVLEMVAAVVLLPIVAWRRRRDRVFLIATGYIWVTSCYVMVVTNFVELGENNRFRFDLGPLPLVALAVVTLAVVRHLRSTAVQAATRGDEPSTAAPGEAPAPEVSAQV